jgi:sensor domain CHASE-containing protein
MGLIKFIFWTSLSLVFLYFTITSIQNLMAAQEDVKKAEQEVAIAQKEFDAAQKELDNVVTYGCANPTVSPGLVSCRNG